MSPTYLAALGGGASDADVVALCRTLARPRSARVLMGHVSAPESPWDGLAGPGLAEAIADLGDRALAHAARLALPGDPPARTIVAASPARGLLMIAAQEHAQLIVVGSSGRGAVERVLLGTTALQVLRGGRCPVAVAPSGYADREIRAVGVVLDGSSSAEHAVAYAGDLAWHAGGSVKVVAGPEPGRIAARSVQPGVPVSVVGDLEGLDVLVCATGAHATPWSAGHELPVQLTRDLGCPVIVLPSSAGHPEGLEPGADYGAR